MGQSFSRPSPETMAGISEASGQVYYHQPSRSYFTVLRRGGQYVQRRYQLDAAGRQVNVMEKQVDYVMGSGLHSRAYLHQNPDGTLVELPLAWYSEKGGYWAMNPGYDRPDHEGFRRAISYDCLFCHNAYPKIPPRHDQPLATPVYEGALPLGIDCQRCHGPGSRHVQMAGAPGSTAAQIRVAIVNPARLTTDRQLEVCMVCHLETTSFPLPNALERYERGPFSFVPGEPLADFILNFDHAPGTGREGKFEIVSSAYRLRRSACFLKSSSGAMLCTTCHNPHEHQPDRQHYNDVCQGCHEAAFRAQIAAGQHTDAGDCVGCHMPKRRTEDVVHVVMTDHFIQRRPPAGNLLAERSERQESGARAYRGPVVLYYPETLPPSPENQLYLAVAQVKQGSNLKAGIERLRASIEQLKPARAYWYLELAEALDNDGRLVDALPRYREAVRREPESAALVQRLGTALRRSGAAEESAKVLQRAAALDPQRALTWHELGLTYQAQGKTAEAVKALREALQRDPEMPEAHNNLGNLLLAAGDVPHAEGSFREAIRIQPDYADAHANLAGLLMRDEARWPAAREEFQLALARPTAADAGTRYNYAMLLGRTGDYDGAQRELESCLRSDPNFADAHELLGDLLMGKNRSAEALPHYREALRIHPDSARAHLGLGAALLADGNRREALPHLQRAAASTDPDIRTRAAELVRQIGPAATVR